MWGYRGDNLLIMVERYATIAGFEINSEKAMTQVFNREHSGAIESAFLNSGRWGVVEIFTRFAIKLADDREIHPIQAKSYSYIGKYSNCDGSIMTQEEYVEAGGNHCVKCRSENIGTSTIYVEAGSASQKCFCQTCEAEWNDVYKLVGYSDLKEGNKNE